MIESIPRPIAGLGAVATAVRPSWCPPAEVPRDPCEIAYPVDIPLIGRETVGVPVYRMVYDAMQAGTKFLPEYLPEVWQQLQPYIAEVQDDVVRTIEYEADYLADELLDKKVMPRLNAVTDELVGTATGWRDEILMTLMAVGAASIIAVGVSAWWINKSEQQRDKGVK